VVWSPSGKAAITYRVVQGVALASGDPIGDPEAWPGAMAAFRGLVGQYGWTPAVIGCGEHGATVFKRECGLSALEMGDEAIIDVDGFTLDGRSMRGVRQACARAARAGYTVQVRRARDVDRGEFATLAAAAEAWRGDSVERGFSMALSRLGDPSDLDCVLATACHGAAVQGLLHFVPWGADGLSLDLMRRDRDADNGLNELMIAKVLAPLCGRTVCPMTMCTFAASSVSSISRGTTVKDHPAQDIRAQDMHRTCTGHPCAACRVPLDP
jgi:lysyl-tRNA synthetase class 2